MSTTVCFESRGSDVWLLANATVYEAREVATEFNERLTSFYRLIRAAKFLVFMAATVCPSLRRLAVRQGKLIAKLQACQKEKWDRKDCGELAELLRGLIVDEGNFIEHGLSNVPGGRALLTGYIHPLKEQLLQLGEIQRHLEALSVPELPMPGDADCREFLSLLAGPEEYDFSDDSERKRVPSHA